MPGILRRPPSRGLGRRLRTRFARVYSFLEVCGRAFSLMLSRECQPRGLNRDRGCVQRAGGGVGGEMRRLGVRRAH